jgi:hypothetical protein
MAELSKLDRVIEIATGLSRKLDGMGASHDGP